MFTGKQLKVHILGRYIIFNEHRVIKVCDLVREMKQNRSECCDLLFQRNPAVSLTGLRAVAVR